MAQQYNVQRPHGVCQVTGRTIEEGESFYTVLMEDGESFRRLDYGMDSWSGPPDGAYCYFKTHMPHKTARKRTLVDDMMLRAFFERLKDEKDPIRVQFRFVLALILMRKRLLRYEGMERKAQETWTMRFAGEDKRHHVVNPHLSEEEIESVSKQLSVIMHADMGEWAMDEEDVAAADVAGDNSATGESADDSSGGQAASGHEDGASRDELPNDADDDRATGDAEKQAADKQAAGVESEDSHES